MTITTSNLSDRFRVYPWLEVVNPNLQIGRIKHALFDFDGTISVIRQGWEKIMISLMVEMICNGKQPSTEIIEEVTDYVDRSTGILTIKQMKWLEQAVIRYGYTEDKKTAVEYKRIYNERLLRPVRERIRNMDGNDTGRQNLMVMGALAFLRGLREAGVELYLASGTDQIYVEEEAAVLGVDRFFSPHIYGAREDSEEDSKERIIAKVIEDNQLRGEEFLVVGDGPVEIAYAKQSGAIALGVASDEINRCGFNDRKRRRLIDAGADILIGDFTHWQELLNLFAQE